MRTTTLTVACNLTTKKATFTGLIGVREKVNLVVTDFGTAAAEDLTVALVYKNLLIAKTAGLTTGATYTGILDTNTVEAVEAFGNAPPNTKLRVTFIIFDVTNSCMLVNDLLSIIQNPYNVGMETPTNVDPIGGNTVFAPIEKGIDGGNSHAHHNGDGAQIDHRDLSYIGTNTHAQIDTALGQLAGTTALGNFKYSTTSGLWHIQDVADPTLWHPIQAGGEAANGFLIIGGGIVL